LVGEAILKSMKQRIQIRWTRRFKVEWNVRNSWSWKELEALDTDFDVLKGAICHKKAGIISRRTGS
jgi:hypothetical protein